MYPTFGECDLLEIVPCDPDEVRLGDVIALHPPDKQHLVVHRVVEVTSGGLLTRGDNNRNNDDWLVQSEQLIGRVVAAWRGERRRLIHGARVGRRQGLAAHWLGRLDRATSRLLHPLYRALARSGVVQRLIPPSLRPRVVVFRAGGRVKLRLLSRGRTIGQYDAHAGRWRIERPFRLIVDEGALPHPENNGV
jgi:hypothetical protein